MYLVRNEDMVKGKSRNDGLTSLDGEDVFVCIGVDAGKASFVARRIIESEATLVVVLFNQSDSDGKAAAERFVDDIERGVFQNGVRRRFFALQLDEWEGLCAAHKDEAFSIAHSRLDDSVPIPSGMNVVRQEQCDAELSPFDDIPLVKGRLQQIVEVLSSDPVDGMWPASLIVGETGSGKTFAAEKICECLRNGHGVKGVFKHLNCGEFGKEDMNAALFGLRSEAFTVGAKKDLPGAIEEASGGVLFLDEIGTLPIELQPRLLTVLDNGQYRMHGSTEMKQAECRFIFGTNEDLDQAVRDGRFRFDLYNRISGMVVRMPSVKMRIDGTNGDAFLANTVDALCRKNGDLQLTRRAKDIFAHFARQHVWRGNFREFARLFRILRMSTIRTPRRNIVSAAIMQSELASFALDALRGESLQESNAATGSHAADHPLLRGRTGLGANERVLLSFAFKCAAESATCQDAGRMFFYGKYRSNHNWNSSFSRYLAKFGFRWDKEAPGHILELGC